VPLTDWLSHITRATGIEASALEDPVVLEDAVADLWLSGALLNGADLCALAAPPTLAEPCVRFCGLLWSRCLASWGDLTSWGADLPREPGGADPAAPAIGVPLSLAREIAHTQGGRLPRLAEWEAAVVASAPGNHGLKWGGPSAAGVFPAARSGILDGWGNAWEWTEEGVAVGGSFASPPHPAPVTSARLTSFRIVR